MIKQVNYESDKIPEKASRDDILGLKTIEIGEYSENKSADLMKGAGSFARHEDNSETVVDVEIDGLASENGKNDGSTM